VGHGSFGQVLRCFCRENHQTYALKVIKNLPAYIKQASSEKKILEDVYKNW
jgi:dual specificity protein kinase YAK1